MVCRLIYNLISKEISIDPVENEFDFSLNSKNGLEDEIIGSIVLSSQ